MADSSTNSITQNLVSYDFLKMEIQNPPAGQTDLDAIRIVERAKTIRVLIVCILLLCGLAIIAGTVVAVTAVILNPVSEMQKAKPLDHRAAH